MGVEHRRFQSAAGGWMERRLFLEDVREDLVVGDGLPDQAVSQCCGCGEARGTVFTPDFRKGRGFPIPLNPIAQRDAHEQVLSRRPCSGGDDKGIGDRDIHRPDLNGLYGVEIHRVVVV